MIMKIFKLFWSLITFPFRMFWKLIKAIWKLARRLIIKMPASETEAFLMSLALILCCIWIATVGTLVETRYVIQEKVKIIQEQAKVIETYKVEQRTITLPGKVKIVTVDVRQLQQQVQKTQQEADKLRREKSYYEDLVKKYSRPGSPYVKPEQRVKTEENINDQFITDWSTKK